MWKLRIALTFDLGAGTEGHLGGTPTGCMCRHAYFSCKSHAVYMSAVALPTIIAYTCLLSTVIHTLPSPVFVCVRVRLRVLTLTTCWSSLLCLLCVLLCILCTVCWYFFFFLWTMVCFLAGTVAVAAVGAVFDGFGWSTGKDHGRDRSLQVCCFFSSCCPRYFVVECRICRYLCLIDCCVYGPHAAVRSAVEIVTPRRSTFARRLN